MKSFAASDFKNQIGDMFMAAAKSPVQITKRGKEAYVLMSEEQFRRFGDIGPKYEIIGPAESLEDGDLLMRIRVLDSDEEVGYKLSDLLEDPVES